MQRWQLRRLENLERGLTEIAEILSRSSVACICFPVKEQPIFNFPIEGDKAFLVKCKLHGDRFVWPVFFMFRAKWAREKAALFRERLSLKYNRAWAASFPSILWPAEEEEADEGTYLRLKDGTRLLAEEFPWRKSKAPPTGCRDGDACGQN